MIVGSVCLSHSPLIDSNSPARDTKARFDAALEDAASFVAEQKPDLTIVFHPDHLNGFFYRLLPPFCIGLEGASIGDYGSAAGELNIPLEQASDLARYVLDHGVDVAISHQMKVDHGAVQPLEWLLQHNSPGRVIPIFVNCAASPLPTFRRARALGVVVGEWARQSEERVLIIGSGGLSHDPPMPSLATASPELRERMINGTPLTHAQRAERQNRASSEGRAMAAGTSLLLSPDGEWDRMLLDAFAAGQLTVLDEESEASIIEKGGRGAHEIRVWIAALAALKQGYQATELFYEPVSEWITGMGILVSTES